MEIDIKVGDRVHIKGEEYLGLATVKQVEVSRAIIQHDNDTRQWAVLKSELVVVHKTDD